MAVKEVTVDGRAFEISYERSCPENLRTLLFLHGWGSSKIAMKAAFAQKFVDFGHIYVDMPGFGDSPNSTVLTTTDYAKILASFLQSLQVEPYSIFGHSFGGKVAALLHPARLVLLSSAGIVPPKPLSVRVKISIFKLLKKFGLARFWRIFASPDAANMSKAMYETLKNVVDERFDEHFAAYSSPAWLFWGKSDTATPIFCGEKAASLIKNSKFYAMDGDHWFFLKNASQIEQILLTEWAQTPSQP